MKFKVGDVITCIDDDGCTFITDGETYTVLEVFPCGHIRLSNGHTYQPERFK